jgi:hypothetical protein
VKRYGKHHSKESSEKMSKSRQGSKNHRFGIKVSESTKQKLREKLQNRDSKNNPGAKPIRCIETQKDFYCIRDASKMYSICESNIGRACRIRNYTAGGFHWEYKNKS